MAGEKRARFRGRGREGEGGGEIWAYSGQKKKRAHLVYSRRLCIVQNANRMSEVNINDGLGNPVVPNG